MITEINDSEWFNRYSKETELVLVHVYKKNCCSCKSLEPYLEEMSEVTPQVIFLKLNAEECPEFRSTYNIQVYPTVLLVESGTVLGYVIGFDPLEIRKLIFDHV